MSGFRKVAAVAVVVFALVAGAACTNPPTPEQLGSTIGGTVAFILTSLVANAVCAANPSCPSPICVLFPCALEPAVAAGNGVQDESPPVDAAALAAG